MSSKFIKNIFFFFLLLFLPSFISADIGLSVGPAKIDATVFPGSSYSGQIKIHNPSPIALPVDLRIIPFGAEEGTGDVVFEKSSNIEDPVKWINLEERNFLLAPGENRRARFTIEVPKDAPEGGYYVIAQIQARVPDFQMERRGARSVPSIGVPILISATEIALDSSPESDNLMEVTRFSVKADDRVGFLESVFGIGREVAFIGSVLAQASGIDSTLVDFQIARRRPDEFVLSVRNNDVFHFQPEGTLKVYDSLKREVGRAEMAGNTILPGMSRDFSVEIEEKEDQGGSFLSNIYTNLMMSRYTAELDLKGRSPIYGEINPRGGAFLLSIFSISSFFFWVFMLMLLVLVFLGRRRIFLIAQVLFKK